MNESGLSAAQIQRVQAEQLEVNARGDWVVVSGERIASRIAGRPWLLITSAGKQALFLAADAKAYTATLRPVSAFSAAEYRGLMDASKGLDMQWLSPGELTESAPKMAGFRVPFGLIYGGRTVWFGGRSPALGADVIAYAFQEHTLQIEDAGRWGEQVGLADEANRPGLMFLRASGFLDVPWTSSKVLSLQEREQADAGKPSWSGSRDGDDRFSLEALGSRSGAQSHGFQGQDGGHAWPLEVVVSPGGFELGVTAVGWHGQEAESKKALACLDLLWQGRWLKFVANCARERSPRVRGQGGYGTWEVRARESLGLLQWAQLLHVEMTRGQKSLGALELLTLSWAYMHEGSYKEAFTFARAASQTFGRAEGGGETSVGNAQAREVMGAAAMGLEQWGIAARSYATAHAEYSDAGDVLQASRVLQSMAGVALAQKNESQALRFLDASQRGFWSAGARSLSAKVILDMSYIAWTQGQPERARRWLDLGAQQAQGAGEKVGQEHAEILDALYTGDVVRLVGMRDRVKTSGKRTLALFGAALAWLDFRAVSAQDDVHSPWLNRVEDELFRNSRSVFCAVHQQCGPGGYGRLGERFWRQLTVALYRERDAQVVGIAARALDQTMSPMQSLWVRFAMDQEACARGAPRWDELARGARVSAGEWFDLASLNASMGRRCLGAWALKKALRQPGGDVWTMALWGIDRKVVSPKEVLPYLDESQREAWRVWTRDDMPGEPYVSSMGFQRLRRMWWMRAILRRREGKSAREEVKAMRMLGGEDDGGTGVPWRAYGALLTIEEEGGKGVERRYREVAIGLAQYTGQEARLTRMLALALEAQSRGVPVQEPEGVSAWGVTLWQEAEQARFYRYDAVRRGSGPSGGAASGLAEVVLGGQEAGVSPRWDLPLWPGGMSRENGEF